jgi:hypothetical protein
MKPYEYYLTVVPVPTTVVYKNILSDLKTDKKYCVIHRIEGFEVFQTEKDKMTKVIGVESLRQLYDWCVEEELKYKLSILVG